MALSREMLARRVGEAVHASGMSQRQVAAATGMDPKALNKALTGRRAFKSLEMALIAECLDLSTDVLLADDSVELRPRPALAARLQAGSGRAVQQAVQIAEQLRDMDVLMADLGWAGPSGVSFPSLPDVFDPARQGELLAEAVRQLTGLNGDDLPPELEALASLVEQKLGIDVGVMPLPAGLDGLAVSSGQFHLVLVSSGVAATRQRFTICHEVCHVLAGDVQGFVVDEDVLRGRKPDEQRANAFSAAFLMPSQAIHAAIGGGRQIDESLIVELLGRFRVSLDALAFRLHDMGAVDAAGSDGVRAMSSAQVALRAGRVSDLQARNERRAPGGLLARMMGAFAAGDLGIRPLANLLGTEPDRLLDELAPPRFPPGWADSRATSSSSVGVTRL